MILRYWNHSLTGFGYLSNGHHLLGPTVGGYGIVGSGCNVSGGNRIGGRRVMFGGDQSVVVLTMRTYGISSNCCGRVEVDGV